MKVRQASVRVGPGSEYGPGVEVRLTGSDVAQAIDAYLVAHGVVVRGPRTVQVNGELCEYGRVYVDPSGFVVHDGKRFSGRGATEPEDISGFVHQMRMEASALDSAVLEASGCVWRYEINQYITECGQSFSWMFPEHPASLIQYCIKCGKPVQWKYEP